MPVDNKKQELRSMLAGKSTAELEELLAMDFTETETAEPDVDYMTTILEVIEEREGQTERYRKETAAAWQDFKEYYRLRKQEELLETGVTEEPSHDHHRKTEQGQSTRRSHHALRFAAVAAAAGSKHAGDDGNCHNDGKMLFHEWFLLVFSGALAPSL